MSLTHVCVWEPQIGYRRVTISEACKMYPYGVTAKSGHFVCELCAQNVLLTQPGINARHFRHDPSEPNKECDDRQATFDPTYGISLKELNSHTMPLRIAVNESHFSFELGFFCPPNRNAHCDEIRITSASNKVFVYSFERIESIGTTYLNVGPVPCNSYALEYVNASAELKKFWSESVQGVSESGSFFDARTCQLLQKGGKAYAGNRYYLLLRGSLPSIPLDIEAKEISILHGTTWHLYSIRVKHFSEASAKFFLKFSIFLTEKPTRFYPIWPAYVEEPYFIYHNSHEFYFYICGDDAELRSYPPTLDERGAQEGKLYRLFTQRSEQLISVGKSGALGFSYLIRQPLSKKAALPSVVITDLAGNTLSDEVYSKLPKSGLIFVSCPYDGRAILQRNGRTEYVYKLSNDHDVQIDGLSFGTEIRIYQGCDCIRSIRFERYTTDDNAIAADDALVRKLKACSGPTIPVTHAIGALASRYAAYPQTRQWLYRMLKQGDIPREAYRILTND